MVSLPLDHCCDGPGCDPEDAEHMALRRKKTQCSLIRADVKADQAWAKARDAMPSLIRVKDKLDTQSALVQEDVDVINMALRLVLGELYLRQSRRY